MLGERLRQLREEAGLTQIQLAKMVNLSQQTIGHYEVNRSEPNIKTLELLAGILSTSVDYLLGLSDIRHPNHDVPDDLNVILSDLPLEARKEIEHYLEFIREKYKK